MEKYERTFPAGLFTIQPSVSNSTCQKNKLLGVGFEPTRIAAIDLKSTSLDHSDILASSKSTAYPRVYVSYDRFVHGMKIYFVFFVYHTT